MFLSYKYRLCPRRSHRRALEKAREASRILYNAALEERISAWAHGRQRITYQDQCKSLTAIRHDADEVWGGYSVNMGRWALGRLDDAFKGFFGRLKRRAGEGRPGFPRFRSQSRWKSFGFAEASGFALAGRRLRLKGIATSIRVNMSRPIPQDAVIKACVVSEDCGLWYATFQLELPDAVPIERTAANAVAYDWGIENALTGDDGSVFTTIQPAKKVTGAVRRAQRAIARSKRGSRTRRKRIEALGRLKRAERRARHNALHQLAAAVVAKSPWIGMEALQVKNMTGSARGSIAAPGRNVAAKAGLNRSILDGAPAALRQITRYKAAKAGGGLIEKDPRRSSQDCAACGRPVPKALAQRQHRCACGFVVHRDVNAACNMRRRCFDEDAAIVIQFRIREPAGAVGSPEGHSPIIPAGTMPSETSVFSN